MTNTEFSRTHLNLVAAYLHVLKVWESWIHNKVREMLGNVIKAMETSGNSTISKMGILNLILRFGQC